MLAAAVAIVPVAAQSTAQAAVESTKWTRATYLQHALGLPANNPNPVIEAVTYDRFQHLLQQEGNFAILIGDPATDPTFAARAQDVEAAAAAANVKKLYWFNPNLSGNAKVGAFTAPNLDIRKSSGIALSERSQGIYSSVWLNLVGQYLGNGVTAVQNQAGTQSATVTATTGTTTSNDYGDTAGFSTEVGDVNGGALYDYKTTTPADVQDSFFLIYNKARTVTAENRPSKIAAWINLSDETASAATRTKVTTAIDGVGAANLTRVDQFAWWKSEANVRHKLYVTSPIQGRDVDVVTDADNANGWRVNQISYPELVDLLENVEDANAVILFGGTWCPNTRAVLPFVNKRAQEQDLTVYNFDTILDGGIAGGRTTNAENPLQTRNNAAYTGNPGASTNANPSFLFGEVQAQFLSNLVTEYKPTGTNANPVNYYPGADTSKPLSQARRLQVPYLIGYQGKAGAAPYGGVARQWIHRKADGDYVEYMSQWYFTNPQANQLGLTQIPQGAAIWPTINAHIASFTWKTDPATLVPNTTVFTDAAQYLVAGEKATVTFTPATGTPTNVTASAGGNTPVVSIDPDALAAAKTALGAAAPDNLTAAKAALLAAPADENLKTVFAAYQVTSTRKNSVLNAYGTLDGAGGLSGGARAVRAVDVFFGGLPGGPRYTSRTLSATPVKQGAAPAVNVTLAGTRARVGNLALDVKLDGASVFTATADAGSNAPSFTLPALAAGTYSYTVSYAGSEDVDAFSDTGTLTVAPADPPAGPGPDTNPPTTNPAPTPTPTPTVKAKVSKVAGAVAKAPTSKKAGKYKITISTAKGQAKATGKVTIKLTKGKTTKTVTGTLSNGTVTVTVPKLAKGTWKVAITWPGDTTYQSGKATGTSIKVKK